MPPCQSEERVLIIAPLGQDAASMAHMLRAEGVAAQPYSDPAECATQIMSGAGALLITEEALELPHISVLLDCLEAQPAWSELPVIVLTRGGENRISSLLDVGASAAGTVTVLERPMSASTLLRSIEVALRSRRRQYQVRDLLTEQQRKAGLIASMFDGVIEADPEFRIRAWNPACERMYGWTAQEAIGRCVDELLQTEFEGTSRESALGELLTRGSHIIDLVHCHKSGRRL